jgi:hypothetical protein
MTTRGDAGATVQNINTPTVHPAKAATNEAHMTLSKKW